MLACKLMRRVCRAERHLNADGRERERATDFIDRAYLRWLTCRTNMATKHDHATASQFVQTVLADFK